MADPGESMTTYASRLGTTVRALYLPMTALKRASRLRSTGTRNNTRYYPKPGRRGDLQAPSNAGVGVPSARAMTQRSMKSSTSRPRLRKVWATVMTRSTNRRPR